MTQPIPGGYNYVDESSFVLENGIEKPLSETRHLRYIELENKLRVLLISDETTDTSLASMCVGVGSLYEPEDTMGLAHFVEHLLFMGTERHPDEKAYSKFIDGHNGYDNAYTDNEETNYYFSVSNEYFQEALELFSEFFICPLFHKDSVMRERQAVNSEYVMNIQNDGWRSQEMIQTACDARHPYSRFMVGTEETLSAPNIRERALEFYKKYYSANIMTLVLLSNTGLDELETSARKYFSEVPNFDVVLPTLSTKVLDDKSIGSIYKIIPVNDVKTLKLYWILPSTFGHFLEGEAFFLSHLIGHESSGSLASYLKTNNYVTSLCTECCEETTFMSIFKISIKLTDFGFDHYTDIIKLIYQYIAMLRQNGIPEDLYHEENEISSVKFAYADKDNDVDYIAGFASALQTIPYRYVLHSDHMYRHYSASSMMNYINHLTVDNMVIQLHSKSFSFETYEVEPFYDVHYSREPVDQAILNEWIHAAPNPIFHLPFKNPFIPHNLTVIDENKNGDENEIPVLVLDTPKVSLYLKNTTPYNVPKMNLSILVNSIYSMNTPKNYIKTTLLLKFASRQINEFLYYAELVDYNYNCTTERGHGIVINVSGFSDNIPLIVSTFLHALRNLDISEQIALDIINDTVLKLKSKRTIPVYKQLMQSIDTLLYGDWTVDELLEAIKDVTYEEVKAHANVLFGNCRIEGLLTGNAPLEVIPSYQKIIEDELCPSGVQRDEQGNVRSIIERHLTRIPQGKKFVFNTLTFNESETNSGCIIYMTVGCTRDVPLIVKCYLMEELIKNEIFDVLRTKEQLGYVVSCLTHVVHGYGGLLSIVQSDSKSSGYVYSRLLEFFRYVYEYLTSMDDDEFEDYKESVYDRFTEKINNVSDLHNVYAKEVTFNCYAFDRLKRYADAVLSITKEQMIDFYNQYVNPDSPSVQYAVYLINGFSRGKEVLPEDSNIVYVGDIPSFRSQRDVYPLGYKSD